MRLITAPFVAEYDACLIGADATSPSIDALLTITPVPWSSMTRPASWHSTNSPLRLMSTTWRHWSIGSSSAGDWYADAGVVHEHVDPAEPLDRGGDEALAVGVDADVAGDHVHPLVAELGGELLEPVGTPGGDHH